MKNVFIAASILAFWPLLAQSNEDLLFVTASQDTTLEQYEWTHRPLIIFANSENDVNFNRQISMLERNSDALRERDIIVITDTSPQTPSELRTTLRPRGFSLVLVGKDGQVKLRKPFPWNVRELSRVIDKMPMRRQEMRERE